MWHDLGSAVNGSPRASRAECRPCQLFRHLASRAAMNPYTGAPPPNRRTFLTAVGGGLALAACGRPTTTATQPASLGPVTAALTAGRADLDLGGRHDDQQRIRDVIRP